ncbi:lysylphosphatidylglycerol synthase transmembrane domain-containing protein [Methylomonas sp. AM2-LC]|uniref:lysylphosphatidylglycerol synthase transmembrane domain-containing protein n=1 Tax=Methylomonas sp. AM2-LC TaxID=3153301 RepID=UPI003264B9A9
MNGLKVVSVLLRLIALLLVGWILSQLPVELIVKFIGSLSFWQWFVWLGINLLIMILATQRWQLLITLMSSPVRFFALLMIRQAGQLISFITPGPQFGGEPLQIYWLWKREQLPLDCSVLALGLDRFYELWINFSMLVLGVLLLLASPMAEVGNWQEVLLIVITLLSILSVLGGLILRQPERAFRWVTRLVQRWQHHPSLKQIETQCQQLTGNINTVFVERKALLLQALLLSLCGWLALIGELWLLLGFVNINLDFSAFLIILMSIRLAFLLPLPGGIGTLEAALFWAFHYLQLPTETVVSLIALMRLRDALVLLLGLWCLQCLRKLH